MTQLPSATFEVVRDDYREADWPNSRHDRETLVTGDLADVLREHYSKSGDVTIVEHGAEGGYSEYTVEWDWDLELRIGGDSVWGQDYYWGPLDLPEGYTTAKRYRMPDLVKLFREIVEARA